ncbi:uncharacterized protein LOC118204732, partial [Stegodyphus dumicola]|uniref:uncharacterized protein LOC118204732 n=1 Tax=Stegodyphus dumicola TaxID=202533 RepID=UPI0015B19913
SWKATKFHLFLLYTRPVVMNSILPSAMYNNFLLLHVEIFILIKPSDIAFSNDAFAENDDLRAFVKHILGELKNMLCALSKPLQQLARRYA